MRTQCKVDAYYILVINIKHLLNKENTVNLYNYNNDFSGSQIQMNLRLEYIYSYI